MDKDIRIPCPAKGCEREAILFPPKSFRVRYNCGLHDGGFPSRELEQRGSSFAEFRLHVVEIQTFPAHQKLPLGAINYGGRTRDETQSGAGRDTKGVNRDEGETDRSGGQSTTSRPVDWDEYDEYFA